MPQQHRAVSKRSPPGKALSGEAAKDAPLLKHPTKAVLAAAYRWAKLTWRKKCPCSAYVLGHTGHR